MPRLTRWLVPIIALMACAFTRAGASAAPHAPVEGRIDAAAQAATGRALTERKQRSRDSAGKARRVLGAAVAQIGDGYAYGAGGPDAFDCSGLMRFAFARAGLTLPHDSHAQAATGRPVDRGALRRGDLVFFSTAGPGASHVGVATSATTVVSATSSGVMEHPVDDAYWGAHYVGARRVLARR